MVVVQGVRVRLYPAEEQEVLINKTIGCCRFVHNQTLADCKQSYAKHLQIVNSHMNKLNAFLQEKSVQPISFH